MACMTRPSAVLAPKVGFVRRQLAFRDTSVNAAFLGIKNDTNRQGLKHYCDRTTEHAKEANDVVFLNLIPPFKALNAQSVVQILRKSILVSEVVLPPE